MARLSDLTALAGLEAGTLQPVPLDWLGVSSPQLNLLFRKAVSRQPRMRAVVDFLAETGAEFARQRLLARLHCDHGDNERA